MEKVSVIITIFNEEKTLERLIKSLFSQTMLPDEVIIVDGGSVDKSIEILKSLKKDFPKLQYYVKKGNRSVGRNYAIKKAKNEIIAVTDAGCYPKKDWLQTIVAPFKNRQVQVVSGYYREDAQTPFQKAITPYFLVMPDKLPGISEFLPSSRSMAIRKKVWEKVGGYPEKYDHNEDLVFDYEIKKSGYKFYFEKNAIVYWIPPGSLWHAIKTFYRFSLGDAEADIPRPKVKYIAYRYYVLVALYIISHPLFIFAVSAYLVWSVQKNFRYAKIPQSIFWLPVIQVASDIAIMMGTLKGKFK